MNKDDLISRAAAIQICKSNVPDTNPNFYNLRSKAGYGSWMHSNGEVCAITNIEIEIKKLPTIDAVPVVHGRWEEADDGDGKVCSTCGEDFCDIVMGCNVHEWKYCPNCGAKMDGE